MTLLTDLATAVAEALGKPHGPLGQVSERVGFFVSGLGFRVWGLGFEWSFLGRGHDHLALHFCLGDVERHPSRRSRE